jgi:uroporphyrinogen-III decarboxylase
VREVIAAFEANQPVRVPVTFGISENYFLLTPELNRNSYSYREYCENPDVMMEVQLGLQKWARWNVRQDVEMGPPSHAWDSLYIDLQNTAEAAWLGCPVNYGDEGSVPDTQPILAEHKEKLYEMAIPDPLRGGIMNRVYEHYGYLCDKLRDFEFEGSPVAGVVPVAHMTDGPFTLACNLRGATQLCTDIYEDPGYATDLMRYVTDAIIARGKAWYEFMGVPYPMQKWLAGFADDSTELLSPETYREFVLPCHHRIVDAFSKGGPNHIHMCGRAQHLFRTMQSELNIQDFYVGFCTDTGRIRQELGEHVLIQAEAVHPTILRDGEAGEIRDEYRKTLSSGVMAGGKVKLGATVAPGTPVESLRIAYEAARELGRYR